MRNFNNVHNLIGFTVQFLAKIQKISPNHNHLTPYLTKNNQLDTLFAPLYHYSAVFLLSLHHHINS